MRISQYVIDLLHSKDAVPKVLAFLLTPGGVIFWIDRFRSRVRVKVAGLRLGLHDTEHVRQIVFDAENIGPTLTSLDTEFVMTGYHVDRKKYVCRYTIQNPSRQLPVHDPQTVVARHNAASSYPIMLMLWYMTYRIRLTRGGTVVVRVLNGELQRIGFLRFHWGRFLFRWFHHVPKSTG